MFVPTNPKASQTSIQGSLSDLQVQCIPIDDHCLLDAVRTADIVIYLADGVNVDHPVLQDFRRLITRLNPWAGAPSLNEVLSYAELAVGRRSILTSLELAVYAGSTLVLHQGKPRRVLAIYYASPLTSSVTVTVEQQGGPPTSVH